MAGSLENLTKEQQQELALGKLTKQLLGNADTAEAAQRLLMKGDPKIRFPELELRDQLTKVREETAERVRAAEEDSKKLRAELRQKELHAKVTAAGLKVEDVVKVLEKHGMASTDENYDLAIRVLRQDAELAQPSSDSFGAFQPPDTKELWADPTKWRQNEAEKVLQEIRGSRRFQ